MENEKKSPDSNSKRLSQITRFSGMGLQMGITIWFASLIGEWLDKKYPSDHISWFKILTIFAVFGTTYSAIHQLIQMSKKEDEWEKRNKKPKNIFRKKK